MATVAAPTPAAIATASTIPHLLRLRVCLTVKVIHGLLFAVKPKSLKCDGIIKMETKPYSVLARASSRGTRRRWMAFIRATTA